MLFVGLTHQVQIVHGGPLDSVIASVNVVILVKTFRQLTSNHF